MGQLRRNRSSVAVAIQPAVRCATYARVSTDAQADKAFNSVEAQCEACETYVGLHREEGWTVAPEPYLDAGFSGSNTKRPGLQRLIADIEAGEIDVVVVYKYDRLSRSMLDFLQLLDFFKAHGVSFVSVSQRFDTSTPVGEMTLNILLSFAQFERQIIAERTRDKIHACRRRGRWTGGRPPLGYDVAPAGGKITVNKVEADQVRTIFDLYLANPSLLDVVRELNQRGWRQKRWTTKGGKQAGGTKWNRNALRTLLRNPLYAGMQKLGDEIFKGEHKAIITKKTFDRVQRLMDGNRDNAGAAQRNGQGFLVRGLLRCSACDASMTPHWTKGKSRVYRYYTCVHAQKHGHDACPVRSVSADKIEQVVIDQIRRIVSDPDLQNETFRQAVAQVKAQRRGLTRERRTLKRDLEKIKGEVKRLVAAVARTTGAAADAIAAELEEQQTRVRTIEGRLTEIDTELASLKSQEIDRDDLARALAEFEPIWDALLIPERERVVRLLVVRISYDGRDSSLDIEWRMAGFGQLAAEVAP